MGDNKAGNIEAIRDWSKRYFYTKSDIGEFFIKQSSGLSAYSLTIVGPANTQITINDNDQSNPQEYVITTDSRGTYQSLFFFNDGNTLTLTGTGIYESYTLSEYIATIWLVQVIMPTMLSQFWSNVFPGVQTQISVTGCSDYERLLVVVSNAIADNRTESQALELAYIEQGTNIGHSGSGYNTGSITNSYIVPVTDDTMTLTGSFRAYQVYGINDYTLQLAASHFRTDSSEHITSITLSNYEGYSKVIVMVGTQGRGSLALASQQDEVYINNQTELGYCGCYGNNGNWHQLSRTYEVALSGTGNVSINNLSSYSGYQIYKIAAV